MLEENHVEGLHRAVVPRGIANLATKPPFIVSGLVSVAFGVLLFARPGVGVLTLALLFGLYALITAGIQLRQLGGHAESRAELHDVA